MKLTLYIDETNNIYDESDTIVGEQRGKDISLAPFVNAPFIVSGYPEGWKLDAKEWPIKYKKTTLDIARKRQYYECYNGLFIIADDNDLQLARCGIHLKREFFDSLDNKNNLLVTLEKK